MVRRFLCVAMVIGVFVGPATAAPADQSTERIRAAAGRALAALPSRRYPAWSGGFGSWPGPWPGVLAASRNSMATVDLLLQLERGVQSTIAMSPSLYRRPTDLEGIAPSQLDSRSASMVRNKVAFALASCDVAQADVLRTKGVELAMISAWRGDAAATAKALDMLAAFADRSPLQRPGWSLTDDSITLRPGGDGVWLATAWGIGGIVDMVGLMGDRIPSDLRSRLDQTVRAELERIVTDWADARPWYVKGRDVASNQWIEPCVAMVRACLHLRDPALGPAYDLAVENLGLSIAAQGADGAFMEGFGYAEQTCGPLSDCLGAMQAIGDARLRSEPWSTKAWAWFLHMNLVGGAVLNSHDCRMSQRPDWAMRTPMPSEVSVLLGSGDPAAIDAGMFLFPQGSATLPGIRWSTAIAQRPAAPMRLPTFASFPSQGQVVWRSAWEPPAARPGALAVWVRGGTLGEGHLHRDNGQVSVVNGSRHVLMECGTPDYGAAGFEERYARAAGHGIMQVGEVSPRGRPVAVAMEVRTLDASGGSVRMDTTQASTAARSCTREVTWDDRGRVVIIDAVSFTAPVPAGTEVYRFHTGSTEPLEISGSGLSWNVSWRGATLALRADRPILVAQQDWPDAVRPPFRHRVLTIEVAGRADGLKLDSTLQVDRRVVD
jgi:hypothetical protein